MARRCPRGHNAGQQDVPRASTREDLSDVLYVFEDSPLLLLVLIVGAMIAIFLITATAAQHRGHASRTDPRVCRKCGASHPSFAAFCRRCGTKL